MKGTYQIFNVLKWTLGKLFTMSVMVLSCMAGTTSCTKEALTSEESKFNVSVILDTKALDLNEVHDIAIYVFAQAASGKGYLAGYLYDDQPNAEGIFPITLTESGAMDFYVILNPNSNCFYFEDQEGNKVNIGEEPVPGITPEAIRGWKIMYSDSAPQIMSEWQIPMSNLDGTSYGNRRFNIEAREGWQTIPISVVRAVSKVEVWFRSDNDSRNNYWGISSLESSDPVRSTGAFIESTDHMQTGETPVTFTGDDGPYYFENTSFPTNADKSNYYSEKNFAKIFEYYILPNTIGGNNAGAVTAGTPTENYTSLKVDYFQNYYSWYAGWEETPHSLTVYLPACERNTCIRVWCPLNNNEDNSFTYTVIDWDETVTVNIPDFS